jgi:hypothetical protein
MDLYEALNVGEIKRDEERFRIGKLLSIGLLTGDVMSAYRRVSKSRHYRERSLT